MSANEVALVEVGPRDGFQSVAEFIPTETKIAILKGLHATGLRRIEATSFVSATALPQMRDAEILLAVAAALNGCDPQVLIPSVRQAERALAAGAKHLAFVVSVSEAHNRNNVRRSPRESVDEYARIVAMAPSGTRLRLNLATAFDCPFEGAIDRDQVLTLLEELIPIAPDAEIALCDTTGRVTPGHVGSLFKAATGAFPFARWAFHGHDTYGMGVANVLAAWQAGVRVIDASIAGLGGCPFAPGATGNVATEDVLYLFEGMGVKTGVSLPPLLDIAQTVTSIPGAQTGGRVRHARASAPPCVAASPI